MIADWYEGDSPETIRNKERYREQNSMNCKGPYHMGCDKCEPVTIEESDDE